MPVTLNELNKIASPPKSYADWLDCFEMLAHRNVSREELDLLEQGECIDAARSIQYLEEQLVRTINAMIQRYIHAFNREIEMCAAYGEYNSLHTSFCKLAAKFRGCLFFRTLSFMSVEFRDELEKSVMHELTTFWNRVIQSLYAQCVEHNDFCMEDQLFMIRRIKLF